MSRFPYEPYDPEVAIEVINGIKVGKTLSTICAQADMPDVSSVHTWLAMVPAFNELYENAVLDSKTHHAVKAMESAEKALKVGYDTELTATERRVRMQAEAQYQRTALEIVRALGLSKQAEIKAMQKRKIIDMPKDIKQLATLHETSELDYGVKDDHPLIAGDYVNQATIEEVDSARPKHRKAQQTNRRTKKKT